MKVKEKHHEGLTSLLLLVKHEKISAARAMLHQLQSAMVNMEVSTELQFLEVDICISERNLEAARGLLAQLRSNPVSTLQLRRIDIVEAYAEALAGRSRESLGLVSKTLREGNPFDEWYAKASYVAGLALFRGGHYKWARAYVEKAAAYYRLAADAIELSKMLNSVALIEKCVGEFGLALKHFDEAVRLLPPGVCQTHRRRLFTNRGVCLLKLGRAIEARACLSEALRTTVTSRDHQFDVSIDNNLGHTYRMQAEFKTAESYYLKALERARESSSSRQECLSLEFLGELYLEMGRFEKAREYLNRAHGIALKLAPHGDLMMEILRRRGELSAAMGKIDESRDDLVRAIRLSRSRGEVRERLLCERALALLEVKAIGDLQVRLSAILEAIRELGDRFEYMRTVVQALARYGIALADTPWFSRNVVTATHYADTLGLEYWREWLNRTVGYSRELIPGGKERSEDYDDCFVVSNSRAFSNCLEAARIASRSDSAVLISGETGVGKEVVARLVHQQSARANGPLVAINCGALPEGLVESELFGHARGTFTGAHRDKEGLLEAGDGGSVFLDEIGELPLSAQVKLLRFLDSGEFRRVGETKVRKAHVRILAATNRDLKSLTERGAFRSDLLFRLNVFHISVPALRSRREDIIPLMLLFLEKGCGPNATSRLTREVREALERYEWPGNVRELKNTCDYMAARAWGKNEIQLDDLPTSIRQALAAHTPKLSVFECERLSLEREQIIQALKECGGKVIHAAKLLGMSRNTLAQRMKEHGIVREAFRV